MRVGAMEVALLCVGLVVAYSMRKEHHVAVEHMVEQEMLRRAMEARMPYR